jgi:hypothetical protein
MRLSKLVLILFIMGLVFPVNAGKLLTGIDLTAASIGCSCTTITVNLDIGQGTATVTITNTTSGVGLASVPLGASTPATGFVKTISYNPALVSEGDLLLVTVSGGNFSDQIRGFAPNCSEPSAPVPRFCDDGRININLCEPIAIYPTPDDSGVNMTVMIFEHGAPESRFGFFVSAQQLANLPRTPHQTMKVAQSRDGFAVLYWLASNEFQINAGPDFEGKTFVFRFSVFPNQTPIVETFFGGARIPLTSTTSTTPATTTTTDGVTRYVVQPGDNLFRIGLRFDVSFQQIATFNGITDATRIFVGQVLLIPQS